MHKTPWALLICCAAMAWTVPAQADGVASVDERFYPLAGASLGATWQEEGYSSLLGAELSLPYFFGNLAWVGGWVDATWDVRAESLVTGIGPEAGWFFFGMDGGYVAEISNDTRHGVRARLIGSLVYGAIYLGYTHWIGEDRNEHVISLGFLFKFPLAGL